MLRDPSYLKSAKTVTTPISEVNRRAALLDLVESFILGLLLPQRNPLVHVFELDSRALRLLGMACRSVAANSSSAGRAISFGCIIEVPFACR
jgi:hypothetical protein